MNRREFVQRAVGGALGIGMGIAEVPKALAQQAMPPLKKAIQFGNLPRNLTLEEKFNLAKKIGWDGVEVSPMPEAECAEMRAEAQKAGIELHSVVAGWQTGLASDDPQAVKGAQEGTRNALRTAKDVGADTILLVTARVNEQMRYAHAYERTQKNLRPVIPDAQDMGIVIAIENVWNNFLLSPIEFARYVDEFESPFVQAYFDVGNVVKYGWPEDWIRTLGKRLRKVHLKDFDRGANAWKPLREGSVNWPEVRRALAEVGYSGYLTTEVGGGDEAFLTDLAQRVDLIIAGK